MNKTQKSQVWLSCYHMDSSDILDKNQENAVNITKFRDVYGLKIVPESLILEGSKYFLIFEIIDSDKFTLFLLNYSELIYKII